MLQKFPEAFVVGIYPPHFRQRVGFGGILPRGHKGTEDVRLAFVLEIGYSRDPEA